jgi:hypothetical protein
MSDIFLSYSHDDMKYMRKIRQSLRLADLQVWTDEGIEVGTANWQMAVEEAIENAKCLVCVLTPRAKKSIWVREEIAYAVKQGKVVYMIHTYGTEEEVAIFGFAYAQTIDIRERDYYNERIDTLVNTIKRHHLNMVDKKETGGFRPEDYLDPQDLRLPDNKTGTSHDKDNILENPVQARIPVGEVHRLIIVKGKQYSTKTTFEINKPRISIGRADNNHVILSSGSISREHCHLVYTENGFALIDSASTHGTALNGKMVRQHYLENGDYIQLANVVIQYKTTRKAATASL